MRPLVPILVIFALCRCLLAQEAAQPAVTPSPIPLEQVTPPPLPSATPVLPELSALDEAFKQTGLGKDADEMRTRIELRGLQNQVSRDPAVIAAKAAADRAPTDLEKREKLREYYKITYALMSQRASNGALKAAIEQSKQQHIALLAQPRVRPETTAGTKGSQTPAPTPEKKKKHKKSGKRF